MEREIRTAVFPGSFNPFTIGHKSIVERGLALFDRVIIAVGYNEHKAPGSDIKARVREIGRVFEGNPAVSVEAYRGLTVDFMKEKGATAILRGVRNITDFEYERNLADINREIAGAETVILIADPGYGFVSSSMVRELESFGYDTTRFRP